MHNEQHKSCFGCSHLIHPEIIEDTKPTCSLTKRMAFERCSKYDPLKVPDANLRGKLDGC